MPRPYCKNSKRCPDAPVAHIWTSLGLVIVSALNLAIIVCASIWFHQLGRNGPYRRIEMSTKVKTFIYAFALPITTFIAAPLGIILAQKRILTPALAVKGGGILFIGWATQTSVWFSCESDSDYGVYHRTNNSKFCPSLVISSHHQAVGTARWWTGLMVTLLIFSHLGLSVMELSRSKRAYSNIEDKANSCYNEGEWIEKVA
ncbi:hypothetical protein GLAREA_10223 [Glarea lozoyensis ATCC 20868]|uniref:Uncharacterized protein n=1 Tax=Glarea lozoyensis (strain ATCC 20868 / MF5171) TaxID=1116229 RepID=S3DBP0_GLAL2|nr:uncharacterized protein GLAREA_10223 [Glarea lozoyensis ATCC 20868]EPE34529.1 hypothetical protein GLAREA_10223 [Glarea lozoyensis ATCC 20868]